MAGVRPEQALPGQCLELPGALVEVSVGRAERIGLLPTTIALQDPEQPGRQIPLAPAAYLMPGQAAFEGPMLVIHELATDGGEETKVVHQIDGCRQAATALAPAFPRLRMKATSWPKVSAVALLV